ncbi:MAG TPA: hypothetical protein VGM32_12555 [Rhodopila sp.]
MPIVVMRVELSAFDHGPAGLNDPPDVAGLSQQLTRGMDSGIA